ncbi:MAG: sensor histidine kinase, partial [Clostridiales bacterium]
MQRIAGLEQAYKFEKTVDTLKLQQREKELALERQTYINHFLIAGSAIAIVFILILFSRYKLVKTNKEITEGKNKEIEKQKFQLEQLNATKDKFFSIIAHDLKNPFNILFGLSDMLLEDFNQLSEDEKLMLINQIKNVSRSSFNLLENLLQWSMSQSNSLKVNPQRFNLSELVTEAKLSVCENAKAKEINLFSDAPQDLMANDDYNIVLTVLRNLLMNAIKFTQQGGEIKIISQVKNDKITICVQDNGIGM